MTVAIVKMTVAIVKMTVKGIAATIFASMDSEFRTWMVLEASLVSKAVFTKPSYVPFWKVRATSNTHVNLSVSDL